MSTYNLKFVWSIVLALAFVLIPSTSFVVLGQTLDEGPTYDSSSHNDPGEAPVPEWNLENPSLDPGEAPVPYDLNSAENMNANSNVYDPGEAPVPVGDQDTVQSRNAIAGGPGYKWGIVTCQGTPDSPCNFEAFVKMINGIIKWIISIAGVIFAITLIYGGFLYMTSGDNPGNKTKATDMMWNTLKGFVIILTAWLIVYTILKTLAPNYPALFEFIGKN